MAHFSRLTDIVECNLTRLLQEAENPQETLREIIQEMENGLAGARRSMQTATSNVDRLQGEMKQSQDQVAAWTDRAKSDLQSGNEEQAKLALIRRREIEDVAAGLEQQLKAAEETRDHLMTTFRALEARQHEAERKMQILMDGGDISQPVAATAVGELDASVASEIEDELASLKRELGQGG